MSFNKPFFINHEKIKLQIHKRASEIINTISSELNNTLVSIKVDAATRCDRSFLGIIAQYIKDCKILIRTLDVIELKQAHSSNNLKNVILDVLKKFKIELEIFTVLPQITVEI